MHPSTSLRAGADERRWTAEEALRFLEWLGQRGIKLAVEHDIDHPLRVMQLVRVRETPERLVAEFLSESA